jgi:hypothetical protein
MFAEFINLMKRFLVLVIILGSIPKQKFPEILNNQSTAQNKPHVKLSVLINHLFAFAS